jgi:hypothetical protein
MTRSRDTASIIPTVDAKGDLLVGTANNEIDNLPAGTNGTYLKANSASATGLEWGTGVESIVDAKGDLLVGTADNTVDNLSPGTNGQVLTANSATTTGLQWITSVPVANGGTGATALSSGGYLKGAGTSAITSQSGIPAGDITSGTLDALRIPGIETFSNTVSFLNTATGTYNAGTYYPGPSVSMSAVATQSYIVQFQVVYGGSAAPHQRVSTTFNLSFVGWKAGGTVGIRTSPVQHHNDNDFDLSYRMTPSSAARTWEWSLGSSLTVASGGYVQIDMKRIF